MTTFTATLFKTFRTLLHNPVVLVILGILVSMVILFEDQLVELLQ